MGTNRYKIRRGRLIKRADNIVNRDKHQAEIARRLLVWELRPMVEAICTACYSACDVFLDTLKAAVIGNPYPPSKKQEPQG